MELEQIGSYSEKDKIGSKPQKKPQNKFWMAQGSKCKNMELYDY